MEGRKVGFKLEGGKGSRRMLEIKEKKKKRVIPRTFAAPPCEGMAQRDGTKGGEHLHQQTRRKKAY